MCTQETCEYGRQCDGCLYFVGEKKRGNTKTGIDTSDRKAYNREWMRRYRAKKLRAEMEAAGVL